MKYSLTILLLCICAWGGQWELLEPSKSMAVNCLFPVNAGRDGFLIGNDSGLFYLDKSGGNAQKILDLPVHAMEGAMDIVFVAAGNGSASDGIYRGDNILDGAPYFDFKTMVNVPKPKTVTVVGMDMVIASDTAVWKVPSFQSDNSSANLKQIPIKQHAFGESNPSCNAAIYTREYGYLVGGSNPDGEATSVCKLMNDSLVHWYDIPVNALGIVNLYNYWTPTVFMGSDSGLYLKGPKDDTCYATPDKGAVTAFATVRDYFGKSSSVGVGTIGTKSGVYYLDMNTLQFEKVGDTISDVRSLYTCMKPDTGLFAGTGKGLYVYNPEITPVIESKSTITHAHKQVTILKGNKLSISSPSLLDGTALVRCFTYSGKLVFEKSAHVTHSRINIEIDNSIAQKPLIIQVSQDGSTISFPVLHCR